MSALQQLGAEQILTLIFVSAAIVSFGLPAIGMSLGWGR